MSTTAERWEKSGSAAEAAKTATLEEPAQAVLKPEHRVPEALTALVKAGHPTDAIRLLAAALDRREMVWWAAQCVRSEPGLPKAEIGQPVLVVAESWAARPSDDLRRQAYAAAEKAGMSTPAAFVGLATFFSEGSLSPPTLPPAPAAPHAAPAVAAGAVIMTASAVEPHKAAQKYDRFIALGLQVAQQANRWPESPGSAIPPPLPPSGGVSAAPGGPTRAIPVARPVQSPPPPPPHRGFY